jgi:crossover junction endodeoxyribonuclease RuvC
MFQLTIIMKKRLILGLDLSICHTGYSIGTQGKPIAYGEITTKPRMFSENPHQDTFLRVNYIYNKLQLILSKMYDNNIVGYVGIEGYAMGVSSSKTKSLCDLAELGGLVKQYLHARNIPFLVVPPTTVKKYATGNGRSKKEEVQQAMYDKYQFHTTNNNIADACSIMNLTYDCFIGNDITIQKKCRIMIEQV